MGWLWWLGAALVLIVIEMLTIKLVFLMLGIGAAAAMVASLLGGPLWVQVAAAVVTSVVLLAVRPGVRDRLARSSPTAHPEMRVQVGESAEVLLQVSEHTGRITAQGEVWSARAAQPGAVLPAGTAVRVVRTEGSVVVVEAAEARHIV